jgi:serine/threonine protein kinase
LRDRAWVVGNFEAACQGSDGLESFEGTGVNCYRAPELVILLSRAPPVKYSNKIDIWALGCILFELAMRRRAFRDDSVTLYATHENLLPSLRILDLDAESQRNLSAAINMMIALDPDERATAKDLCDMFNRFLTVTETTSWDLLTYIRDLLTLQRCKSTKARDHHPPESSKPTDERRREINEDDMKEMMAQTVEVIKQKRRQKI